MVADGRDILSSVVASQVDVHRKYGGVVPELASREHLRQIVPVVREALAEAGLKLEEVDAIGVTQGPGLVGMGSEGRGLYPERGVQVSEGQVDAVVSGPLAGAWQDREPDALVLAGGPYLER